MKNYFKLIVTTTFLILLSSVSYAVTNGSDEIEIRRPSDGANISGTQNLEWFMADSDQEVIPFQIDLFRRSCTESGDYIGAIADNNPPISPTEGVYKYSWDTTQAVDGTQLSNGGYCLRICGVFVQNSNNYYSLCDKKSINLVDDNGTGSTVTITSSPSNLNVAVGGSFSYQVVAEDSSGGELTYSINDDNSFLEITSTGLIRSTENLAELGTYEVNVTVTNSEGVTDTQTFSINVIQNDSPFTLSYTEPEEGNSYQGSLDISWNILDSTNLKQIIISYSKDQNDWNNIVSLETDVDSYTWDISQIESGDYFLRITLRDTEDNDYFFISGQFGIGEGGSNSIFTSVIPEEDSQIGELRPNIIIFFSEPEAPFAEDSLLVNIDGSNEVIECGLFTETVECSLTEDLAVGNHEVSIQIDDQNGNSYSKTWIFEVVDQVPADGGDSVTILGRTIPRSTFNLAIGILCIGLVLLLVPWFLYYSFKKRQRGSTNQIQQAGQMQAPPEFTSMDPEPINMEEYQPQVVVNEPVYSEPTVVEAQPVATPEYMEPEIIQPEPIGPSDDFSPPTNTTTAPAASSAGMHMPSSYTDEEIPDWLKDFEADQPITPAGGIDQDFGGDSASDSKVHDSYGLSLNPDSDDTTYSDESK